MDYPVRGERRRLRMKFELILAVDSGDGEITNVPLAQMTRPDVSELATLGLSLCESKQLLAQLQHEIVTRQFEATMQQRRHCGQCAAQSGPSGISMGRGSGVCSAMSNSGCRGCANANVPWTRRYMAPPMPRCGSAGSHRNSNPSRASLPQCCPTRAPPRP